MTPEQFENQRKIERTLAAIDAAIESTGDAFYAVQEASVEVERVHHRTILEGNRSRLRQLNQGLRQMRETIDSDREKVAA